MDYPELSKFLDRDEMMKRKLLCWISAGCSVISGKRSSDQADVKCNMKTEEIKASLRKVSLG